MMKNIKKPVFRFVQLISTIIFILSQMVTVNVYAQDSHYWTNQYGTRAQLLSGNVVGSIEDLSSTYYNPGVVAFTKDMNLLLSTDAFEWVDINIQNGAGNGLNLKSTDMKPAPNIIALRFDFYELKKHQWAVSLLTKRDFDFETQVINVQNKMSTSPDSATRSGEFLNNLRLTEPWIGISWAYPLNENLGFGITQYIAIRSHRGRLQTTQQVSDTSGQSALNLLRDFSYYNVRLLWKVGLIYKLDRLNLGLTVTTPSINLFGSGRLYLNSSLTDNTGNFESDLDAFHQDDLNTFYSSPFSIAVGASYNFESSRIYFTSEWFHALNQFNIFDAKGLSYEFGGQVIPVQLTHVLNSVINFGVGIQYRFGTDLGTYFGFNTDFSAVRSDSTSNIAIGTWDIFHFTIGASFRLYEIDFNLGLGYGFSNTVFSEVLNINKTILNDSNSPVSSTEAKYQRFKLILGLSL